MSKRVFVKEKNSAITFPDGVDDATISKAIYDQWPDLAPQSSATPSESLDGYPAFTYPNSDSSIGSDTVKAVKGNALTGSGGLWGAGEMVSRLLKAGLQSNPYAGASVSSAPGVDSYMRNEQSRIMNAPEPQSDIEAFLREGRQAAQRQGQTILDTRSETARTPYSEGGITLGKVIPDVAGAATSMVPTLSATLLGSPVAGAVVGGAQEGGSAYSGAVDAGMRPGTAALKGAAYGGASVALNKIGLDALMKKVPDGAIRKVMSAVVAAGTEGATEAAEEPAQNIIFNPDKALQTAETLFSQGQIDENGLQVMRDAIEAFIPSAVVGGGVRAASMPSVVDSLAMSRGRVGAAQSVPSPAETALANMSPAQPGVTIDAPSIRQQRVEAARERRAERATVAEPVVEEPAVTQPEEVLRSVTQEQPAQEPISEPMPRQEVAPSAEPMREPMQEPMQESAPVLSTGASGVLDILKQNPSADFNVKTLRKLYGDTTVNELMTSGYLSLPKTKDAKRGFSRLLDPTAAKVETIKRKPSTPSTSRASDDPDTIFRTSVRRQGININGLGEEAALLPRFFGRKKGGRGWDDIAQEAPTGSLPEKYTFDDFAKYLHGKDFSNKNLATEYESGALDRKTTPQPVNEAEMTPGDLVKVGKEWYSVEDNPDGGKILADGERIPLGDFDSVDAQHHITPDMGGVYEDAHARYKRQEAAKASEPEPTQSAPDTDLFGQELPPTQDQTRPKDQTGDMGFETIPAPKPLDTTVQSDITEFTKPMRTGAPRGTAEAVRDGGNYPASGIPLRPTPKPETPKTDTTQQANVVEQPELVRIARELMGSVPRVRKNIGDALGRFRGEGPGSIELKADIFTGPTLDSKQSKTRPTAEDIEQYRTELTKTHGLQPDEAVVKVDFNKKRRRFVMTGYKKDPTYANRTIAHEIGHAVDYLPDRDLRRGNILGRIATLKKHMLGSLPTGESRKAITEELKALSQWWKPFAPIPGDSYTKYRHSSIELYADALSVMLNHPEALQSRAPKFWQAFENYLDRKPEVRDLYDRIQEEIRSGANRDTRVDDVYEMFRKGEAERTRLVEKDLASRPERSLSKLMKEAIATAVDDRVVLPKDNDRIAPREAISEMRYVGAYGKQMIRDVQARVDTPLLEAGASVEDLGVYLELRRAATERETLANPLGIGGSVAEQTMQDLRVRLGEQKFAAVEQAAKDWWAVRKEYVMPKLRESGLFSDELLAKMENNEFYATFNVVDYMEKKHGGGPGAGIYKQIGTLADVENVFTATLQKDLSMLSAAVRNRAKAEGARALDAEGLSEPAETFWRGDKKDFREPADSRKKLLVYTENGELQGRYVDRAVADLYESDPVGAGVLTDLFRITSMPLKGLMTTYSPMFLIRNPIRDIRGMYKNLPGSLAQKATKLTSAILKAHYDAYADVFMGRSTELTKQAYMDNVLLTERGWRGQEQLDAGTELQRIYAKYRENPELVTGLWRRIGRLAAKPFATLERANQMAERMGKLASYRYMRESGLYDANPTKAKETVRTRGGSPDFRAGGRKRVLLNNVFLFSNAKIQGMRAGIEAFKEQPAQYVAMTAITSIVPRLALYGAAAGAFGSFMKQVVQGIPDHDKQFYNVIPLGLTDEGKSVYIPLPEDHEGQFFGSLAWAALKLKDGGSVSDVIQVLASQNPAQSLNPLLRLAVDAMQYMTGRNPYNAYYGELAMDETTFEAGGARANKEFGKYEWNQQFGYVSGFRFKGTSPEEVQSEFEKVMDTPGLGPLLKTFVRVSDKGIEDAMRVELKGQAQKDANRQLDIRDLIDASVQGLPENATKSQMNKAAVKAYKEAAQGKLLAPGYSFGQFRQRYLGNAMMRFGDVYERAKRYASRGQKKIVDEFEKRQESVEGEEE